MKRFTAHALSLASVLGGAMLSIACSSSPEVQIDPAALMGCRTPSEPGCAVCCEPDGTCRWYTGTAENAAQVPPWYNASGISCEPTGGICPAQCARCLKRDEEALRATAGECDCDKVVIGIDPCFSDGCECTCDIYLRARDRCPAPQLSALEEGALGARASYSRPHDSRPDGIKE